MALDLTTIRDGLKTTIDGVAGVRAFDTVPDQVPTSSSSNTAVIVEPDNDYVDYWQAMGKGVTEVRFVLRILVPKTSARAAQDRIDELLSAGTGQTRSLVDALLDDRTLDGTVADCIPVAARNVQAVTVGDDGAVYLSAELTCVARVSGA